MGAAVQLGFAQSRRGLLGPGLGRHLGLKDTGGSFSRTVIGAYPGTGGSLAGQNPLKAPGRHSLI